jgi:tetratricopeptide (TPR) repeat protein
MTWRGARGDLGRGNFQRAADIYEDEDRTRSAARVLARMGEITWAEGHIDQAVEQMEKSFLILGDEPDDDVAALAAQLGRFLFFMGEPRRALERIEHALAIAEARFLADVLSEALNTKSLVLWAEGRREECRALLRHSLHVALENDVPSAAFRAYNNLAEFLSSLDDLQSSVETAQAGLALTRKIGDRNWEASLSAQVLSVLFLSGKWDEALAQAADISDLADFAGTRFAAAALPVPVAHIHAARGEIDAAKDVLTRFEAFRDSADLQERTAFSAAKAIVLGGEARYDDALAAAQWVLDQREALGAMHQNLRYAFAGAVDAALALGSVDRLRALHDFFGHVGVGESSPFLRAHDVRIEARLRDAEGQTDAAEAAFADATASFREIGMPFWLGVTLLEHGEWLVGQGRADDAEPLLAEAREVFARLEAKPWLERTAEASEEMRVPA